MPAQRMRSRSVRRVSAAKVRDRLGQLAPAVLAVGLEHDAGAERPEGCAIGRSSMALTRPEVGACSEALT
jgi:hypothetical protein